MMLKPEFFSAVAALRALPPAQRTLALHMALHWAPERVEQAEHDAAIARAAVAAVTSDLMAAGNVVLLAARRPCT